MAEKDFGKITEEVINVFGINLISDLVKKLKSKNKFATGRLINSLTHKLSLFAEKVIVDFSAEEYIQNIEIGRKPGSYPPISPIRNWIKIKGLENKRGIEFMVQKSIYKFGIKPTPTIEEVISNGTLSNYSSKIEVDFVPGLEKYTKEVIEESTKK